MFEGLPPGAAAPTMPLAAGAGAPRIDPTLLAWLSAQLGQGARPRVPFTPRPPSPASRAPMVSVPMMPNPAPAPGSLSGAPSARGPILQAAAAQDQIAQLLKLLRGFLPPQALTSGLDVGGQARMPRGARVVTRRR